MSSGENMEKSSKRRGRTERPSNTPPISNSLIWLVALAERDIAAFGGAEAQLYNVPPWRNAKS